MGLLRGVLSENGNNLVQCGHSAVVATITVGGGGGSVILWPL